MHFDVVLASSAILPSGNAGLATLEGRAIPTQPQECLLPPDEGEPAAVSEPQPISPCGQSARSAACSSAPLVASSCCSLRRSKYTPQSRESHTTPPSPCRLAARKPLTCVCCDGVRCLSERCENVRVLLSTCVWASCLQVGRLHPWGAGWGWWLCTSWWL